MKRAILLPTPGDPFLFSFWLHFYEKNLHNSGLYRLLVNFNGTTPVSIVDKEVDWLLSLSSSNKYIYHDHMIDHGAAINELLEITEEPTLMLAEDDCFLLSGEKIDRCFDQIETSIDIVGSKRGSCGMEILERAKQLWGLDYHGYGDQGCNFWPAMFFIKTEILKSTDRHFGARLWRAGQSIDYLDGYMCTQDQAGDTFVNTSLQLRNLVSQEKISYIPQHHAHPEDIEHHQRGTHIFEQPVPWVHIGSLSSGLGGVLDLTKNIDHMIPKTNMEIQEWERRVQVWQTAWKWTIENRDCDQNLLNFAGIYRDALNRVIDTFYLNKKRIARRQEIYQNVFNI